MWFACAGVLRSRTSFMLLRSVYAHWSATFYRLAAQ